MIEAMNLQYDYRYCEKVTLQDVSITIKPGEIVVLVGRNGAGKSTLGKLLAGIIKPRRGTVLIDGLDVGIRRNNRKVFKKVGIVFQNPETQIVFDSIDEEMLFSLGDTENIDKILSLVGLDDKRQAKLWDLSLGQKQRVVLAEILARKPSYLVLDEPTTMINSADKIKIREIIQKLATQGVGILLITNSAEELLLGDRILVLTDGRIESEIKAHELLKKSAILQSSGVALPQLLQLACELQKFDITLEPKRWTPQEVAAEIREKCS